jgi:hypothetical protein
VGPVTEQSEHLSSAQIENYGIRTSGAGPDAAQRDEHQRPDHPSSGGQRANDQKVIDQTVSDQRVEAHLADCASCRNRLLDFHRSLFASPTFQPEPDRSKADNPKNDPSEHGTSLSGHSPSGHSVSGQTPADSRLEGVNPTDSALADSKFANPKYPVQAQVRTAPTPECPSDDDLRQLAAGLTPGDLASALTRHAATCDHCGPLLRTFTEDFSDDFSPEEQAVLNNLQSASASWQRQTARKMLRTVVETRWTTFWKWAPVAAAACALVIFGVLYSPFGALSSKRDTPEKVQQLLAQAYPQERPVAVRWPDSPWGEIRTTRGSTSNNKSIHKSMPLLEANETIERQQKNTLAKPEWLHVRARSALLSGPPSEELLAELREAIQSQKNTPLMFDLAIANFRQGEATGDVRYYQDSRKLLDEILKQSPSSSAAFFNRGIVEERLNLKDLAMADFESSRNFEKDGAWKEEIRQRIERLH